MSPEENKPVTQSASATPPGAAPAAAAGTKPRKQRKWLPTLGVAAVIVVLVGGGRVAVGATEEPPRVVPLTSDVSFSTASGWVPIRGLNPGFRFSNSEGVFDALPVSLSGDAAEVWRKFARVLAGNAQLFRTSEQLRIVSIAGVQAVQGEYVGSFEDIPFPIEGQITTLVPPSGTAVAFDAWAPPGRFASIAEDVTTMVASIRAR
jgi:hypothetical protein